MAQAHPGEGHRLLVGARGGGLCSRGPRAVAAAQRRLGRAGPVPVRGSSPEEQLVPRRRHRRGDGGLCAQALLRVRVGDDRVAHERVHERQARRSVSQQARPRGSRDVVADDRDRPVRGRGQQGRRDPLGHQRGAGDGVPRVVGQPEERRDEESPHPAALGQQVVEAARLRRGLGGEDADVEGVAVGPGHELVGERTPCRRRLVARQPLHHLVWAEPPQRERLGCAPPQQVGQRATDRRRRVIASRRHDEHRRRREVERDVSQQRHRQRVGPVQVLEEDQQPRRARCPPQPLGHGLADAETHRIVVEIRRGHGREDLLQLRDARADPAPGPQHGRTRVVDGIPVGDLQAQGRRPLPGRVSQRCLADAALTGHEHETAPARRRGGERPVDDGELFGATDDRDHEASIPPATVARRPRFQWRPPWLH